MQNCIWNSAQSIWTQSKNFACSAYFYTTFEDYYKVPVDITKLYFTKISWRLNGKKCLLLFIDLYLLYLLFNIALLWWCLSSNSSNLVRPTTPTLPGGGGGFEVNVIMAVSPGWPWWPGSELSISSPHMLFANVPFSWRFR